ncbi:hypothetical protein GCM10011584_19520 [Nocardioides phosphati]|uniref:Transposase n=1 Tax=Nocardioides phosphati TaxID=1867775 RepID=A0ABQ2NC69_9ACTN|nr:hypothetical protein GCM10011584_19520 [Nocardioides phosphati]
MRTPPASAASAPEALLQAARRRCLREGLPGGVASEGGDGACGKDRRRAPARHLRVLASAASEPEAGLGAGGGPVRQAPPAPRVTGLRDGPMNDPRTRACRHNRLGYRTYVHLNGEWGSSPHRKARNVSDHGLTARQHRWCCRVERGRHSGLQTARSIQLS